MKELFQPLWNIYMRNQKFETELAYKSAKCNALRQCGVITDPHITVPPAVKVTNERVQVRLARVHRWVRSRSVRVHR